MKSTSTLCGFKNQSRAGRDNFCYHCENVSNDETAAELSIRLMTIDCDRPLTKNNRMEI